MRAHRVEVNEINIPQRPDIPDLSFRYFQGKSDYQHMVEVFNQCKGVDGMEYTITEESISHHYTHLERCDLSTDMVFIEVDHEVIGYARVGWYPEDTGDRIYYSLGWILPDWRKQGIGTSVLLFCENRLREIAAEHPPDCKKFFQAEFDDHRSDVTRLLKGHGYQETRWFFEMTRPIDAPLPEVSMPLGLAVRPVPEDRYRAVFDAQDEAFRDHWGHVNATETDYQRFISDPTFDPSLWKVAWDGEEVAGMVLNFINKKENEEYQRKRGYTENISVRRPYRRQGLARYLLVKSIEMFREMGMEETALGVDAQNPNQALNLYEGVGYQVRKKYTTCRKPLIL
jgi:ribosomal protein S18 acetylase RimI-like enzyme